MDPAYYSEYAAIQRDHWWYQARSQILEDTLQRNLTPSRERRLLDIGCGPGGMRPMLSRFGRLTSTDFAPDALRFCRSQQLDELVAADAMRLPFRDGRFDVAVAFDVIEHLSDDQLGVAELYRVLRPGGLLMVTVPACQFLWGRQDIVSHHYRRYSASMLRKLVLNAGFELRKLSYFNTLLFPSIAGIRLLYRLLGWTKANPGEVQKSDFNLPSRGLLNEVPRRIFASETALLARMNLPIGVSLLSVAVKPQ